MARQTTLFGSFTSKSKDILVYPNPRTDFERFVNKFVSRDKGPKRKEELVKAAAEEWKSGGSDTIAYIGYNTGCYIEAWLAINCSFEGGGGGGSGPKLILFVSWASANFCDDPLLWCLLCKCG